jgi:hypothetical protein
MFNGLTMGTVRSLTRGPREPFHPRGERRRKSHQHIFPSFHRQESSEPPRLIVFALFEPESGRFVWIASRNRRSIDRINRTGGSRDPDPVRDRARQRLDDESNNGNSRGK